MVGTQSSLLAYDVEKNSDIFYKDVPDGVSAMLFAPAPRAASSVNSPSQMVVVGGNCSLQGFGRDGGELFWTVTGDNVRALTVNDVTGHGRDELVAGSDDFEIRAFQNEEVVFECTETSRVLALTAIKKQMFGYALQNGTVGVYKGKHRAWRVKSKNMPTAIHSFDIDGDGEKEIVMGWSNGKFESRRLTNGEAVHKEVLSSPVAALVTADYRMDGKEEIICCSADGEICGYFTATGDFLRLDRPVPLPLTKLAKKRRRLRSYPNTVQLFNLRSKLWKQTKLVRVERQQEKDYASAPTRTSRLDLWLARLPRTSSLNYVRRMTLLSRWWWCLNRRRGSSRASLW